MKNLILIASMLTAIISSGLNQESLGMFNENLSDLSEFETILNKSDLKSKVDFIYMEETEAPLELENWMTNKACLNMYSIATEMENEEPLKLEEWMTEGINFKNLVEIEAAENPLELKDWMIDNNYINSPIVMSNL